MIEVTTKKQLEIEVLRFLKDHSRGISIELFADLCGLDGETLKNVFIYKKYPMSEYVQRRVSRGFKHWQQGHVAVMQNRDRTRFVEYRKTPQPRLVKKTQLHVVNGEIKLKIGIQNRADYTNQSLSEQLERG
jgi:hypothetical protein